MLEEMLNVTQNEPGIQRRNFYDEYFDLFVWYYEGTLTIKGFQLCYNVQTDEHAVTWLDDKGFSHLRVDGDSRSGGRGRTPILVADGLVPIQNIIERFKASNSRLEKDINRFILSKLELFKFELI